ncbi:ATP-binding protein [Streptomyces sp. NPDC059479]|uniref:ATP-binding protein n=1 Tax=Streptomyces sp. NPDC059479 TaxID=3346848 RepID=UPI00367A6070
MCVHIAGDPALVAGLRRALRGVLRDWGLSELAEDMELIVSELVGNAVRHASGIGVGVLLVAQDDLVLLEVSDGTAGQPAERTQTGTARPVPVPRPLRQPRRPPSSEHGQRPPASCAEGGFHQGEMRKTMLDSVRHLNDVSRKWKINAEDVLLIALNACGARSPLGKPRMRFRLRLDTRPQEPLFLILSLGREDSPFELDDRELRLHGVKVAEVDGIEDDDAVLGYWRNGQKMLTLNSNARSQCTGCVFCPNTLEDASDPKIKALDLPGYMGALAANSGMEDLSEVETVTVCTGCFLYENLAMEHLSEVRAAMSILVTRST